MTNLGELVAAFFILFFIVCAMFGLPCIYPKIRHICILEIMGKIGGADDDDERR